MPPRSKLSWLGIYLAFLLPSLIVAAWIWQEWVCDMLYYCSDSLPFELFCPGPFAHLDGPRYGHTGDYYVATQEQLERIRWSLLLIAVVLPALLLRFGRKLVSWSRIANGSLSQTTG